MGNRKVFPQLMEGEEQLGTGGAGQAPETQGGLTHDLGKESSENV